ncbi:MAG: 4-aminobutyrate--2-oxoglutarate transaminase, partial [Deefgea sp.]
MNFNEELLARKQAATPRGVGVMAPFFVDHAENAELWDVTGRRFIDFAGGIAVLNTGHRHPEVVAAVKTQLNAFTHSCYQVVPYESYIRLAERINALTPGSHSKKTAFFSTGAEAVENAIKIARAATGRSGVIAFSGGFHGRTHMGMALTGKVVPYKVGFGPFPADIFHVPFPNALHHVSVADSLAAITTLFKASIDPQRVAAIILEPIQGEGGFYVAPPELMRELRKLCDEHGILLIADEIQTGFARTGRWFAMDHYDVLPDIMTLAKSLAGGFPLSAVVGRSEIMDAPAPGGLGGSYAGSPVAIAAAHAVLDVIDNEQLNQRANTLGIRLQAMLNGFQRVIPK